MSKQPQPSVTGDFARVVEFLQSRGLLDAKPTAELVKTARRIHYCTYSLILWRFRLRSLTPHSKAFVEEIASDALQVLPQVLAGYSKTVKLLIRGISENALRHIYFTDHPIEFARMNREKKWFMTLDQLCDYTKQHPSFLEMEAKFDALAKLTSLYSDLSAGVHGRTVVDLEMRTALKKLTFEQSVADVDADMLQKCVESVNFLLAVFHRQQLLAFQADDRRIIMRSMPASAREVWTNSHP